VSGAAAAAAALAARAHDDDGEGAGVAAGDGGAGDELVVVPSGKGADTVALIAALLQDAFPALPIDDAERRALVHSDAYVCGESSVGFVLSPHLAVRYDLTQRSLKLYLSCRAFRYELVVRSATAFTLGLGPEGDGGSGSGNGSMGSAPPLSGGSPRGAAHTAFTFASSAATAAAAALALAQSQSQGSARPRSQSPRAGTDGTARSSPRPSGVAPARHVSLGSPRSLAAAVTIDSGGAGAGTPRLPPPAAAPAASDGFAMALRVHDLGGGDDDGGEARSMISVDDDDDAMGGPIPTPVLRRRPLGTADGIGSRKIGGGDAPATAATGVA